MNILIGILTINFIIIIHELGHYWAARFFGIKVQQFGLFFGPKIVSIKRGDTLFSLGIIPVGAFVLMEGEEEKSENPCSYSNKPLWVRAIVIAAGPFMNLLSALLFIFTVFCFNGYTTNVVRTVPVDSPSYNAGIQPGDKILKYDYKTIYQPSDLMTFIYASKGAPEKVEILRGNNILIKNITPEIIPANNYILGYTPREPFGKNSTIIQNIASDSPAANAGLLPGDNIIRLNDTAVHSRSEITKLLNQYKATPTTITVERKGKYITLEAIPKVTKSQPMYEIGVVLTHQHGNILEEIKQSFLFIASNIRNTALTITWLVTGKVSLNQLMGPIGIVTMISDVVQHSTSFAVILTNILGSCAFFSVAVGAANLIPFPALDGGRLLVLIWGIVTKKPLAAEKEAYISLVGLAILILLGAFTIFNDISKVIR